MRDTAGTERLADRLAAAWNAHDAHAFGDLFAQDADFTNVVGVHVTGRTDIERLHARVFATVFRESRLTVEGVRTRALVGDLFAVDVDWSMTGARTPGDQPRGSRRGVMALIVRGGTEAEIVVMHNLEVRSSDGPPS